MRAALTLLAGLAVAAGLTARAPDKAPKLANRYGVEVDQLDYPQAKPQEALASVLKAVEGGQVKYLVAQLADPDWVDKRVRDVHRGKFEDMVEETRAKFANDKSSIRELRRFVNEGKWDVKGAAASASLKDTKKQVFLRQLEGRWFLENRKEEKGSGARGQGSEEKKEK